MIFLKKCLKLILLENTFQNQFFFTMWVQGFKLRLSCLVVSTLTC